ncbi:uncharacterized protein METZ01_LOCUS144538 [marine metagenome]|uniref:Uncharacterized protein n=1 Tax=marine metagenome TaxID=408172 RepID=A0A381ZRC3_9ZZZZ
MVIKYIRYEMILALLSIFYGSFVGLGFI